jgi:hypothetical protein
VDHLLCYSEFGDIPHEAVMQNLELLGTKLMPELRKYEPNPARFQLGEEDNVIPTAQGYTMTPGGLGDPTDGKQGDAVQRVLLLLQQPAGGSRPHLAGGMSMPAPHDHTPSRQRGGSVDAATSQRSLPCVEWAHHDRSKQPQRSLLAREGDANGAPPPSRGFGQGYGHIRARRRPGLSSAGSMLTHRDCGAFQQPL